MGMGVAVCGLNGVGKSTLGKALAEKMNFYFIDDEDLYFTTMDADDKYASSRTPDEAKKLFFKKIKAHENFVFAAVKGKYAGIEDSLFQYVILVDAPKDIRMQRVRNRSFQKFGNRMLPGGDLYEQEKHFFDFVQSRTEDSVYEWVQSLSCPIIKVDGTKPVEENVHFIISQIL